MSWALGSEAPARRSHAARTRSLLDRRVLAAVLAALFVVLGLVGAARYVHDYWIYRGFPRPVTPPGVPAGTLTTGRFYSRALHRSTVYDIYLPPHYAQQAPRGRRFGVLYLLHSPKGIPNGIFTAGAVAVRADVLTHQHRMRPMIIVDPLARTSRFRGDTEWADAGAGRYDSFVVDVAHAIDRHYATIADRQHRGLGGLSMGAYGAVNVALHHLGMFSVAESWSGYFTQTPTGPFAGASPTALAANSPAEEVPRLAPAIRRLGLRAWIYQGTRDDVSARETAAFARELARAGAEVRFAIFAGGHDWRLWRAQIPRQLEDASRWFSRPPVHWFTQPPVASHGAHR